MSTEVNDFPSPSQVLFLLDVSSSMAASLQEVVGALTQLLLQWNSFPTHTVKRSGQLL